MNQLKTTGDYIADDTTGTHIKVTNMGGHYHLYVRNGADRVAELSGNYPTAQAACRRASYLRNALLTGFTVQHLVDEHLANQAGVLNATREVVDSERTVQEITDAINADSDQVIAARQDTADRDAQIVADALGPDRRQYRTWRDSTRRQVVAAANSGLGRYAHGTPNQRLRTAPLTDVMRRALGRADDGVIRVQPGVAPTTLRALAMSGLGDTEGDTRRYEVTKLRLNARGLRMAAYVKEGAR